MPEKNKPETTFSVEQSRRLEAAIEARTLLTQTGFTLSGGPTSQEPIIALAEWILGGSDSSDKPQIVVNVTAVGVEPEDFEHADDSHTDKYSNVSELPNEYWCPACNKAHSIEKLPKGMQRLLSDLLTGNSDD